MNPCERRTLGLACGLGMMVVGCLQGQATGEWISLFDGRTLTGWRAAEHVDSFRVENGAIVADGPRAHLFYVGPDGRASFRNFIFEGEVLTRPGANSGIYFHTTWQESGWPRRGYEVQINNTQPTHNGYHEYKKTGSLYGIRNLYRSIVRDDEWFRMRITVQGRHITVHLNDTLVVDYTEPAAPERMGPQAGRWRGEGTFALQCHDPQSRVFFRNLRVRLLPDDLPETPVEPPLPSSAYQQLLSLHRRNFPFIDLHAHLKGGLTLEDVLARSLATGINYGIAINGGVGFPTTNDLQVHAFADSLERVPVFRGLQAEGREWVRLFSRAALSRFDYVFTDSMTFIDVHGRRTRLWIPEEVEVGEPEAFMDYLVEQIERILSEEPIDIYVNPTYLPAVIADRYDELWTAERMDRVIAAAVRNGVAIEINDRFRLPSLEFIRRAKAAGVKFTFGTNNSGRDDLGYLAYGLEAIRECGLETQDLYVPREMPGRRDRLWAPRSRRSTRYHLYVGTYTGSGSRGIYGFEFDADNGAVRELGWVAEAGSPSFLSLHPDGRTLYAVGETATYQGRRAGALRAFRRDPASGRLKLLNEVSSEGPGPCHLEVDPRGFLLAAANYSGGSVVGSLIRVDGGLMKASAFVQHAGSGPDPRRQKGPHAHSTTFSPDGRFLLVADLGVDRVYVYRVDAVYGRLVPNDPPWVELPPGSGPRHVAFTPDAAHLLVLNELACTLASFAWEPKTGRFHRVDLVSTLPEDFNGPNTCAEVAVHPAGRFVYASNRGHDSIAMFALRPEGRLRPLGWTPTGGRVPRHFALDPEGRWLWAANQESGNVVLFRVDPESGRLRATGRSLTVPQPVCVLFAPVETAGP